jgi:hypothetical protein
MIFGTFWDNFVGQSGTNLWLNFQAVRMGFLALSQNFFTILFALLRDIWLTDCNALIIKVQAWVDASKFWTNLNEFRALLGQVCGTNVGQITG